MLVRTPISPYHLPQPHTIDNCEHDLVWQGICYVCVLLTPSNSIGGLVVKLAVAIRDLASQMIRPAPGSIPGRCILPPSMFAFCQFCHGLDGDVGC